MNHNTDVQVIGGGIGGLATAAFIAQQGRSVTVHESRGRLGGRATTDERGGFRFNQGPHAFYVGGEGAGVLGRLGIVPRGVTPPIRGTRMVRDGQAHIAPVGPGSLLRTPMLTARDKLTTARLLARMRRLDPSAVADSTVDDWVTSLSDSTAVQGVIHTLVRLTTYVNAPSHLSADVAVIQIQRALADGVRYLDRGWEQIVSQIASRAGCEIRTGERVSELPDAPAVVIAAGGPDAAGALTGVPYPTGISADVAVLDLGLSVSPRHQVMLGVDEPLYLSNHGVAGEMAPDGRWTVSIAQYLAPGDEPDRRRLDAFAELAGVAPRHIVEERYLHRMSAVTAIATADAGGLQGRPGVRVPGHDGVFVVGDWVGSRGHLLDAVLASAEETAEAVVAHLDRRPAVR